MQSSGSFRLIVRRGPQPNQIYELSKDVISLGRDITNDIVVNDPEVSRHHCRLTRSGGGYTLEDLGSTNGTFINGQRISSARPLNSGDLIGLGETVTLAYEVSVFATDPSARPPLVGTETPYQAPPTAYPPQPVAPSYPPPPQPAPTYVPPTYVPPVGYPPQQQTLTPEQLTAKPPDYQQFGYQYPEQPPLPAQTGLGRWFFLGCGCFIVACIVFGIAGAIIVDSDKNLHCNLPIVRQVYTSVRGPGYCP
ncbi:MAG: FHA domain-containing protein [Anaerolineae bacterium]|nr:FHA domain-containing protein [Anaerolineae bacterium]MDW8300128.1 FHA domain-containing protein [Anaerolineae bacterium]